MAAPRIRRLLVAGGAGFLGSAFVRDRLRADSELTITVLDRMASVRSAGSFADQLGDRRLSLVEGDVVDRGLVDELAAGTDATVNFAGDEFSIPQAGPPNIARTDVEGTAVLLEAARRFRQQRFLLVSTADVYAPGAGKPNREEDAVVPGTISASLRAAAELITRSYSRLHSVPTLITRCAVAYGPRQPSTQPVAAIITAALSGTPLTIAGKSSSARDYLHVDDQVAAIARVLWKGDPGEIYNVGTGTAIEAGHLVDLVLELSGRSGLNKRFNGEGAQGWGSLDLRRIRPLGWIPRTNLREGLGATIEWYRRNESFWKAAESGAA